MVLNTRKRGLEYIFQRKGNVILIINRGFSGTVALDIGVLGFFGIV